MTLNPDDVTYLLEYAFRAEEALGDVLYDNTTGTPRDYLRLDDQTWDRLDRAYRSLKGDLTLPELRNLHDGRLETVGADLRFVPVGSRIGIREAGGVGFELEASLSGAPLEPQEQGFTGEIKSATFHGLEVQSGSGGWRARVILDV